MTPYEKIFNKSNVRFKKDEELPEDILASGVKHLYYLPDGNTVFDTYRVLEHNEIEILRLRGYQILQEDDFAKVKELINQYGLSR
ncbi:MAG: hypothetical protein ACTSRU_20490 [Candidatus Hodarchaeales archaeon]